MADVNARRALLGINVDGFRAFRDSTSIELRPITLLYGRNQAGKSTLLRLLPFLADSLQDVPVLDLTSPALGGATFKELGWLGPRPTQSWSLTLAVPGKRDALKTTFSEHDNGVVIANRVELGGPRDRVLDVRFLGQPRRSAGALEADYGGTAAGEDWNGRLRFRGLLPEGLPGAAASMLNSVSAALEPVRSAQWLSANRLASAEIVTRPARHCRPDGHDLAEVLRGCEAVVTAASRWLDDMVGEALELRPDPSGRLRFQLRRPGREPLPLHLAGEGVRALLPIALCACWRLAEDGDGPTLLAVEEPEAHLHPSVQIELTNRLIAAADKLPVVLETHSVYILRAIQLAVVEGRLQPADVSLYWVEQSGRDPAGAQRVTVNPDATLAGWQPDAFEEEQRLAHDILDRRWERLDK